MSVRPGLSNPESPMTGDGLKSAFARRRAAVGDSNPAVRRRGGPEGGFTLFVVGG